MDLTFGARLRAQREHQQIALTTIAEETKINVALLEALERDDLSRWPGGLFRRAYVRAYAQKIGLDPEQAVREFVQAYPDPIEATSPVEAFAENLQGKRPKTRIGLMIAGLRPQRTQAPPRIVLPPSIVAEERFAAVAEAVPGNERSEAQPFSLIESPSDEIASSEPPAPRLVMIASPEAPTDSRRDVRALERTVASTARLCARIATASNERDLNDALEDTVAILGAQGAILWAWDPDRDALFPVLAHGYPDELLSRLPEVRRCADNAIADAFRCGQKQIVRGSDGATGAFVAPLLTPEGCAGALALEFAGGAEQQDLPQALAAIVAAQLSTLFAATPQAIDEEWARPDRSLVAS